MDNHELTSRLANLSPAKRALLEQKLKQNGVLGSAAVGIPRRAERGAAPLSFAQQRLWFLSQLEPESSSYNEANAIRLQGPLNIAALQLALNQLVARHEVLRTTIASAEGEPHQVVHAHVSVDLPMVELSATSLSERDLELHETLLKAIQRHFDLSRDLPLRVMLVRLEDQDHVLLKVIHHIASDGWSSGIVWRELSEYYRGALSDADSKVAELPIQYQDYAEWQRNWLKGKVLETQLSYWKQQLEGAAPLQLPFDRPRPAGRKSPAARAFLDLDDGLTAALHEFSRQQGVTLFMTLLAAFQTLLHRYCAQDDIVLGSPIAGRTRPELEDLIGFFVNTLVLRTNFAGNPTFLEVLAQVRNVALGAYAHQDITFEKLVEELNPARGENSTPLFQVLFAYQNVPRVAIDLVDIETSHFEISNREAKVDLFLAVLDHGRGLRLRAEYATDLFDSTTIDRMLGHFQTLLEGIVNNPEQRIDLLPLLTEWERHQLLVQWNETEASYPKDKCVHELFEVQAEKTPDAMALILEDRQLTYRELNKRANQLAHYLQKLGVAREALVGVCMDRSFDMIIAMLGILKAGGAYVPLDPGYPRERLAFVLDDVQAPVVLAHENSLETVAQAIAAHRSKPGIVGRDSGAGPKDSQGIRIPTLVRLDKDWSEIEKESAQNPQNLSAADKLAYVMYTSGSTGSPKGVEIPHRGITRLVFGSDYAQLDASQTLLHLAPAAFDASTFEIWGALLHGAKCVLYPERVLSPKNLGEITNRHGVTTLWLTSSLYNTVIDTAPEALQGLKQLLIGGEALSLAHVRRGLELLPNTRITNGYGPTESTTFSCCYRIPRQLGSKLRSVPIGKPIGNTNVYILDRQMNPVPIGVTGELYIGGDGLARGYLHRPELTVEKFVEHSFGGEPSRRLYKTGDLARYLIDGSIEFLGRLDNQVKIRGYRIELGEIESILIQHTSVNEAVVLARDDIAGDKRLVAYVVPNPNRLPTTQELGSFLKEKLPKHMLPSDFVILDSLPLDANGKLDWKSLPVPDRLGAANANKTVEPRNDIEYRLAVIWKKLLGVSTLGVQDNFFEVGGHSLLAMRLIARIEKDFGRRVPLAAVFEKPTIEKLADLLRDEEKTRIWNWLVPLQPGGAKPPFYLLHGSRELANQIGADQPVYGARPHGMDGRRAPSKVEEMAAEYLTEIRMLQPHGPYFIGGYSLGGLLAFEVAQQLKEQHQEVALVVMLDPTLPDAAGSGSSSFVLTAKAVNRFDGETSERLDWRLDEVTGRVKMLACKAMLSLGQSVPARFRKFYFMRAGRQAARNYIPKMYNGAVIILSTEMTATKQASYWSRLVAKKLDIYKMPGGHFDAIEGAHVKTWAEQLRACLRNG